MAGANRWVWNQILAQLLEEVDAGESPSTSYFSLGKRFTQLRHETDWLLDLPANPVKYCLKYQADAWTQFFRGKKGRPKFKSRAGKDSFTLPDRNVIKIENNHLYIQKMGWYKLRRR